MNNQFRVGQAFFPPKPPGIAQQPVAKPIQKPSQKPFQQWLTESVKQQATVEKPISLAFSQHAVQRLQERGIELSDSDVARLELAVQKAADKGAKESLIMMDQVAYVVSIVNGKVITAVDEPSMKQNVFTNIDSAVFA